MKPKHLKYVQPFIRALKYAVEVAYNDRRRYTAGHVAFTQQGIRPQKIDSEGVTGTMFISFQSDHKEWLRITEHIRQLEDLQEVLLDPGGTIEKQLHLGMEAFETYEHKKTSKRRSGAKNA